MSSWTRVRRHWPVEVSQMRLSEVRISKIAREKRGKDSDLHQPIRRTTRHQCAVHTKVDPTHRIAVRRKTPHQSTRSHIPQEHRLIVATTREDIALWRKCQTVHIVVMSQQGLFTTTTPYTTVSRPPSDTSSTRAYPANGGQTLVSTNRVCRVTRYPVPQPDGLVVRTRREGFGVGRPGETRHAGHVAHQGVHVRARLGVPDHGCSIRGGRGDPSAVGGDADLGDRLLVAAQLEVGAEAGAEGLALVAIGGGRA